MYIYIIMRRYRFICAESEKRERNEYIKWHRLHREISPFCNFMCFSRCIKLHAVHFSSLCPVSLHTSLLLSASASASVSVSALTVAISVTIVLNFCAFLSLSFYLICSVLRMCAICASLFVFIAFQHAQNLFTTK